MRSAALSSTMLAMASAALFFFGVAAYASEDKMLEGNDEAEELTKNNVINGLFLLQRETRQVIPARHHGKRNVTTILEDENTELREANARLQKLVETQAATSSAATAAVATLLQRGSSGPNSSQPGGPEDSSINIKKLEPGWLSNWKWNTNHLILAATTAFIATVLFSMIRWRIQKGPIHVTAALRQDLEDEMLESPTAMICCAPCVACSYFCDSLNYRTHMMILFVVLMASLGFLLTYYASMDTQWSGLACVMYGGWVTIFLPLMLVISVVLCETFSFLRDAQEVVEEGVHVVARTARRGYRAVDKEVRKDCKNCSEGLGCAAGLRIPKREKKEEKATSSRAGEKA